MFSSMNGIQKISKTSRKMSLVCMSWWRHKMETFSALLAICVGNSPVPGEFPSQRPVTGRFDVFFDLRLNKRLNKQSWGWWFETPSHPLWRQCHADFLLNYWVPLSAEAGTKFKKDVLQTYFCWSRFCRKDILMNIEMGHRPLWALTHWSWDKWTPLRRRHFQVHFLEWKCMNFY